MVDALEQAREVNNEAHKLQTTFARNAARRSDLRLTHFEGAALS
ncbi:hypothetical protein [Bradyrhizobium sp. SZCCHNR1015]|nr:hypothetical protein [Bradyrhizobium sp. SZCCHNR1015]